MLAAFKDSDARILQNIIAAPPLARSTKYSTVLLLILPTVTPMGAITILFFSSMLPILTGADKRDGIALTPSGIYF